MANLLFILFNIFTNLFCFLPALNGYHTKSYSESIIWVCSGSFSFIYHLYDTKLVNYYHIQIYNSIYHLDLLYGDLSVCAILSLLLFPNRLFRCYLYLFLVAQQSFFILLQIDFIKRWICIFIILITIKRFSTNLQCHDGFIISWFLGGILCNLFGFVMFHLLPKYFASYYNLFHGFHHLFAYGSIYCYINSIQFTKRKQSEIQTILVQT